MNVVEEETRGHALQERRGGEFVRNVVRKLDQQFRRHIAALAIGADWRARVGHAAADREAIDPGPDRFDDASGLHAWHAGRLQEVEIARPAVDVDEIDADRGVADANLAGSQVGQAHILDSQNLGAAIGGDDDRFGSQPGGRVCGGTRRGGSRRDRIASGARRPPALDRGRARAAVQSAPDRGKAGLIDVLRHQPHQFVLAMARRPEFRTPLPEGSLAVGDPLQTDRRDVAHQRQRRFEQAVGQREIRVGQRQQLLAQFAAIGEAEATDRSDRIDRRAALDRTGRDRRMPAIVAVEIAQDPPDVVDRRIDDRALNNLDHGRTQRRKRSFRVLNPAWNTLTPIWRISASSRSGAQTNSACHSAKVASPSVIGVSDSDDT